jgi:hypothetical protein
MFSLDIDSVVKYQQGKNHSQLEHVFFCVLVLIIGNAEAGF